MSLKEEKLNFFIWEQILTGKMGFVNVGTYKGIVFKIYPKEQGHNEPHCHIEYQGANISISLISYEILSGKLPEKNKRQAVDWVKNNIDVLKKYWNQYHEEIVA